MLYIIHRSGLKIHNYLQLTKKKKKTQRKNRFSVKILQINFFFLLHAMYLLYKDDILGL